MSARHGDAHWMRRALGLARGLAGRTWPNPSVGACIVRDGTLLSEGVHERAGAPHAEALALERLIAQGRDARGATVYVTLEPCHHAGRTPPCSRALLDAGVARVVFAAHDRTARGHGGGGRWLSDRGVEVVAGPFGDVARELIHPFFETGHDSEVHVTLKLALDARGYLARRPGRVDEVADRSITGERAQRRVHRMRAGASAVLVGRRTAEWDRPRLDVRLLPEAARPVPGPRPVVLDPGLGLDPARLPGRALVLHAPGVIAGPSWAGTGLETAEVALREPGRLEWDSVLEALAARSLGVLMVEGGAAVASDLVAEARPHRIHLFLSPRAIDGDGARIDPAVFDGRYRVLRERRVGEDLERVLRRDDLD